MTVAFGISLTCNICCKDNLSTKAGNSLVAVDLLLATIALAILLKVKPFQDTGLFSSLNPNTIKIITSAAKIWFIIETILLAGLALLYSAFFLINRNKPSA